ncbi:hypothetical protein KUH03_05170 [Sphingobacterium sp. E70]|uniref:hypothetical protein n=1 Tax=Sphingobacterium sp. E70 TaxID=2853439 RepID=UPI00211B8804|nr:hypothetical protein [Sphingobacterium sp. E70]ULT26308.1 hypothetical protein KUH03_05170 [Sphingobacterium sp. E70]
MQAQEKLALDPKLEVAASFGPYRPIGVSATSTNRLFVSFPKQNKDYRYALTEIIDGKSTPILMKYGIVKGTKVHIL